jgi:6-phosphofructokinase 1
MTVNVNGFSHFTLNAPNESFYQIAIDYYRSLGFKTVSQLNEAVKALNGITGENKNEKETWLHIFPVGSKNLDGTTIRIVLTPNDQIQPFQKTLKEKTKLLMDGDLKSLTLFATFAAGDVKSVETVLSKTKLPYKLITKPFVSTEGNFEIKELYTIDPLNNVIMFTNRVNPFTPSLDKEDILSAGKKEQKNVKKSPLPKNAKGKSIGILTSGGDSSGMNAAVRAVVRVALTKGITPYAIYEGYQGMVDGGDKIRPLTWEDVGDWLAIGGTEIGTARCQEFRTVEGRLIAVRNLVKSGIDALVICGGDGSLTGADFLRAEWTDFVDRLVKQKRLTEEEAAPYRSQLTIVGLVGSIDNDMARTDLTIGAMTALQRICEALDSIKSTALSHQRAFVVEVMGRHCGWLGLMAAIACGADWLFLPELPPPIGDEFIASGDWETEMCDILRKERILGNRKTIVIVCEGAIDRNLKPIKPEYVKDVLTKRLNFDTRVTCLGHVQRGGVPCAYDRYLATVQGAEAVNAVIETTPTTPSPMIGISNNKVIRVPLKNAVAQTKEVAKAIARKDFKKAMQLRDPEFNSSYNAYIESTILADGPGTRKVEESKRLRVGIMHVGAPAGGMNAATRTFVRLCLNRGHTPLGIHNGFSGLIADQVQPIQWQDVNGWVSMGGSELGINRDQPSPTSNPLHSKPQFGNYIDTGLIAFHMQKNNIQALMIIGGFEAYTSLITLVKARDLYPGLCIPMILLPATVSNNVPGTDFSLGCDTALNCIVDACDTIKQSASSNRKRVFVVEVQGGNCGYLSVMGALAAGASSCYIPEEGITLNDLQKDINHLVKRYAYEESAGIPSYGRLLLRNETAGNKTYTTEVISSILKEEGKGLFDSRSAVLGHLQQGGIPSPLDRIRATRLTVNCVDWLQDICFKSIEENNKKSSNLSDIRTPTVFTKDESTACVIGICGADIKITPILDLLAETNLNKRKGTNEWWLGLKDLTRTLAKYDFETDEEREALEKVLGDRKQATGKNKL